MIRVLVVDDEPIARRRVRRMLKAEQDVEVVGECGNGREAIEAIRQHRPDLVFLDIQMPDVDGFGVVSEIGPENMPAVVFVTAYDEYALRAFEAHALDYLLKPYSDERFARIHRSRIVNTERIKELQPWFNGDYVVILRDGTRLTLSRGYREKLQERLGKGF